MKKKLSIFIILLIIVLPLPAELKDYIVIINAEIHSETRETFNNIADYFADAYEPDLAGLFRSFARGVHGSGFILVDEQGENYIVTNRHVVSQAEEVSVSFSRPRGRTGYLRGV